MKEGRQSGERHVLTLCDGEWVQVHAGSAERLEKVKLIEETITDNSQILYIPTYT